MTSEDFRRVALSLPETVENAHMGHPDFRVGGKIFATLYSPGEGLGMVKLNPDQQQMFVKSEPSGFMPVKGGWGQKGATNVILKTVKKASARKALVTAWRNTASKRTAERFEDAN